MSTVNYTVYSTVQYSTVLYNTVLHRTVLYSTVLYSTVLCMVLCCTVNYSYLLYCTVHYINVQYSTILYGTVLCCTVQICTAQSSTVSTVIESTVQLNRMSTVHSVVFVINWRLGRRRWRCEGSAGEGPGQSTPGWVGKGQLYAAAVAMLIYWLDIWLEQCPSACPQSWRWPALVRPCPGAQGPALSLSGLDVTQGDFHQAPPENRSE